MAKYTLNVTIPDANITIKNEDDYFNCYLEDQLVHKVDLKQFIYILDKLDHPNWKKSGFSKEMEDLQQAIYNKFHIKPELEWNINIFGGCKLEYKHFTIFDDPYMYFMKEKEKLFIINKFHVCNNNTEKIYIFRYIDVVLKMISN